MNETYCKGCGVKINLIPFVSTPHHKIDGEVYCETCAKIVVGKRRNSL